jgi:hypothetical protein
VRHYDITDTVDRGPRGETANHPRSGHGRPRPIRRTTSERDQERAPVQPDAAARPVPQPGRPAEAAVDLARHRGQGPDQQPEARISAQHPIDWEGHYSQDLPRFNAVWGLDAIGGYRERYFRLSEIETKKFSTLGRAVGRVKPRPDLSVRVEVNGVTLRDFRRIREVYLGPRVLAGWTTPTAQRRVPRRGEHPDAQDAGLAQGAGVRVITVSASASTAARLKRSGT